MTRTKTSSPARAKRIIGTVICNKGLEGYVWIVNDVGGTSFLPAWRYRVRILKSWYDYETGTRCIGRLLDPADVATARLTGTSGFKPEDYRKYGDKNYEQTRLAAAQFNPAQVYFSSSDFIPDPGEQA